MHIRLFAPVILLSLLSMGSGPFSVKRSLGLPENAGPFKAGWKNVTLSRGGRTLQCRLYYPATSAGQDKTLDASGKPYPMLGFGHGFSAQVSYYVSYYEHWASWGYVVIAPQFPDTQHGELGLDLLYCLQHLRNEHGNSSSFLYGAVDTASAGLSGHSMGGGASLLAASFDSRIKVVAPLAAAETTPSAISAMPSINGAVCLLAGSADGITPPSQHQQPMYNNALPFKSLPMLNGGNHMRFMDVSLFDFLDPGGNMSRADQQLLSRRYTTGVFNLFLKRDPDYWTYAYGNAARGDSRVTFTAVVKYLPPFPFALLSPLSGGILPPMTMRWRRARTYNPADTVIYHIQISPDTTFAQILFETTSLDTSVSVNPSLPPGTYHWRVVAKNSPSTQTRSTNLGSFSWLVPVELLDFRAVREEKGIFLRWSTTAESNNLGFEVERSTRGGSFLCVGFVPGRGTTSQRSDYSFHDAAWGTLRYRLRQIDLDGKYSFSPEVEVTEQVSAAADMLRISPNPVRAGSNPEVVIRIVPSRQGWISLKLVDMLGRVAEEIFSGWCGEGTRLIRWNASVSPGAYRLLLTSSQGSTAGSICIVR